jgi:hypothetical protein
MGANQTGSQIRVVPGEGINENQVVGEMSFYDENDEPLDIASNREPIVTATAIGTAAKTTASEEPADNSIVAVRFTNGNSAASPTLAFDGGAARDILLGGTAPGAGEITLAADGVALFFFDGEDLHQIGVYS